MNIYIVTFPDGNIEEVRAMSFDTSEGMLVLRDGIEWGSNLVAAYIAGSWVRVAAKYALPDWDEPEKAEEEVEEKPTNGGGTDYASGISGLFNWNPQ